MNLTDLTEIARSLTGDEAGDVAGQVRKDEWYQARFDEGLRLLWDNCPESRLDDTGIAFLTFALTDATTPDETLWANDLYQMDLAHYVAFRFFTNDAGDAQDSARAEAHKKMCIGTVLLR